jgi:glycosyltransferase involved in cell wall biosynthesis
LIVTPSFAPIVGGLELRAELMGREFVRAGHEVALLTNTPGPTQGYAFPVVRDTATSVFLNWLRWCDVQLHFGVAFRRLPVALLRRKRLVFTHPSPYTQAVHGTTLANWPRRQCARLGYSIASNRFIASLVPSDAIVPNPFDEQIFRPGERSASRSRDLVFVGRTVKTKGPNLLLDALARVHARGHRASCTIVGDGELRVALEQQAERLGLGEAVRFTGMLPHDAVAAEMRAHRILVVPSLLEPFGNVAIQGLASRCVPIVARDGGLAEAVGPHGLLFDNGSAPALADAIQRLVADPVAAERLLDGVDRHLERYRTHRVIAAYLDTFERLIRADP